MIAAANSHFSQLRRVPHVVVEIFHSSLDDRAGCQALAQELLCFFLRIVGALQLPELLPCGLVSRGGSDTDVFVLTVGRVARISEMVGTFVFILGIVAAVAFQACN